MTNYVVWAIGFGLAITIFLVGYVGTKEICKTIREVGEKIESPKEPGVRRTPLKGVEPKGKKEKPNKDGWR